MLKKALNVLLCQCEIIYGLKEEFGSTIEVYSEVAKANGSSRDRGKYLSPCLGRIAVPPSDWFIRHLYAQIPSEWFGSGEVSHFADQRF